MCCIYLWLTSSIFIHKDSIDAGESPQKRHLLRKQRFTIASSMQSLYQQPVPGTRSEERKGIIPVAVIWAASNNEVIMQGQAGHKLAMEGEKVNSGLVPLVSTSQLQFRLWPYWLFKEFTGFNLNCHDMCMHSSEYTRQQQGIMQQALRNLFCFVCHSQCANKSE